MFASPSIQNYKEEKEQRCEKASAEDTNPK